MSPLKFGNWNLACTTASSSRLLAAFAAFVVFDSIGAGLHILGYTATLWASGHGIDRDRSQKTVEHGGCFKVYERQ